MTSAKAQKPQKTKPCPNPGGTQNSRAFSVLQIITGNINVPGGWVISPRPHFGNVGLNVDGDPLGMDETFYFPGDVMTRRFAVGHQENKEGEVVVMLDDDSRLLCTSQAAVEDARLLRAQALAQHNATGLAVARYLLGEKLRGQQRLRQRLAASPDLTAAFEDECERLEHASTLDDLLDSEREAALVYWHAWKNIGTRRTHLFGSGSVCITPV